MVKPRYLVGITGRRNLSNPGEVRSAIAAALGELRDLIEARGGRMELYSGIAYGTDTLAVQEARQLGIPVHIILPKPVLQDEKTGTVNRRAGLAADFWDGNSDEEEGQFRQQDWDNALAEIAQAGHGAGGGSLRVTPGSQSEPECEYDANLHVLEAVDAVLAVLDDQPDRRLGGSQTFVALAEKEKLPRIILRLPDGTVERHQLDRLAQPDEGRELMAQLEAFSGPATPGEMSEEHRLAAFLKRLGRDAERDARMFRNSIVRALLCQASATAVAGVAAILPQSSQDWMAVIVVLAFVEFCLVVFALWQTMWLTRFDGTHQRWVRTRFALEISRQIRDAAGLLDPLYPLIAKYQPRWRRFALTVGLLMHHTRPIRPWREARDAYVQDRLRGRDANKGQVTYFRRQFAKARPRFRRAVYWGKLFGTAAVGLGLVALTYKVGIVTGKFANFNEPGSATDSRTLGDWIANIVLRFLPIVVPMLAGLFLALRTTFDSGRRTFRYGEIAQRLAASAKLLASLETESSVRRTVAYTEDVLVDELVEWKHAEEQNGA